MHKAAAEGNLQELKLLVDKDQSRQLLETTNLIGCTPIHEAANNNQAEAVKYLATAGARIDTKDSSGSPLMNSPAMKGHIEVMKILIAAKIDLGATDRTGITALHCCAMSGHLEACKILVSAGAPVDVRSNDGLTPRQFAALSAPREPDTSSGEVAKFLANAELGRAVVPPSIDGKLHEAAINGDVQAIEQLLKEGYKVDAPFGDVGKTPLYCAAQAGSLAACKVLVQEGADVNAMDHWGCTPLYEAVEQGHLDVSQFLVKRKALLTMNRVRPSHESKYPRWM